MTIDIRLVDGPLNNVWLRNYLIEDINELGPAFFFWYKGGSYMWSGTFTTGGAIVLTWAPHEK